jgi:hypothetical protein
MDRRDIVYYSPRCPYLVDFMNQLKHKSNFANSTMLIDIDRQRPVHPISQTPSVVSNNQIFGGSAAFQWLKGSKASAPVSHKTEDDGDNFAPMTSSSFTSPSPGLTFTPFNEEPNGMIVQAAFDAFDG